MKIKYMLMRNFLFSFMCFGLVFSSAGLFAAEVQQDDPDPVIETPLEDLDEKEFDPGEKAIGHIVDANAFHIGGNLFFHLPVMLFVPNEGWTLLRSTRQFKPETYGDGTIAINRFVLNHGTVYRVIDNSFPDGKVDIDGFTKRDAENRCGEIVPTIFVKYGGQEYQVEWKSTIDGCFFGGSITSYYDFSITKNVFSMLLVFGFLTWMFLVVAKAYRKRDGKAPKGFQNFMETIIVFIQDDVAKPFLGKKYDRFLPFLLCIFFFILALNLFGLIPFFPGSANVTGNLTVTMVLALFTFFTVNFVGNKHYWEHIFWMPGIPAPIKLILTPVEFIGLFIKPFTLMLRLSASITAGHIVMVAFVSLIFIFGDSGANLQGSIMGAVMAFPLTLFMMGIELIIALVQAFVFTILTASYLGAATEEAHH